MASDHQEWEEFWNKKSDTISTKDIYYLMDEIKLEYVLEILPPPSADFKTIEVGCGSARLSSFLAARGYRTTCLDYSPNALDSAKRNYRLLNLEGTFILGDATHLSLDDNSYDVVISTGLLEHFPDPHIVVEEMVRILKPGGIFYSDIVPRKFSLLRSLVLTYNLFFGWIKPLGDTFYEKRMNETYIRNMLLSAGLRDINVFSAGVFPPPLPFCDGKPGVRNREYRLWIRFKNLFQRLDRTRVSDWLGFYYFCYGKKGV